MEDNKPTETAKKRPAHRPFLPPDLVVRQSVVGFWTQTNDLIRQIPKRRRRELFHQIRSVAHGLVLAYMENLKKEQEN